MHIITIPLHNTVPAVSGTPNGALLSNPAPIIDPNKIRQAKLAVVQKFSQESSRDALSQVVVDPVETPSLKS